MSQHTHSRAVSGHHGCSWMDKHLHALRLVYMCHVKGGVKMACECCLGNVLPF
jgi:hypothetical protein